MRVLALVSDAFGSSGGIAKFNRDLLRALCKHPSCSEVVAIPRAKLSSIPLLPKKLTYMALAQESKSKYLFYCLKTARKNRIDLIICGHINLIPAAYLMSIFQKAPILLVIHGIDAWQPTNSRQINYLIQKIDGFISVSDLTKQRFLNWTALTESNGFLLPNSIDLKQFSPGRKNLLLLDRYGLNGKKVLLTVGRLESREKYKGLDEVIELLPDLVKEIPTLIYLIVGDGTDRRRLEQKAALLGVDKHVVFTGFVDESLKIDHYRLADAFAMPGWGEGFGIVYLEALACGIPVVASKLDGSREAVRDGRLGILVDPHKPKEVKSGILKALGQPRGVVPDGLDYFSFENFEKRLHGIIDTMLKINQKQGATIE